MSAPGIAAVAVVALLAAGCAGAPPYEPPRLYRELARPAPPAAPVLAPDGPWDEAFAAIDRERAAAEEAAAAAGPGGAVLAADPERLARLAPAGGDFAAAAGALAGPFALPDLEVLALLRSPAVAAAREDLRAAIEGYTEAGALDEVRRAYAAYTAASMPEVGGGAMADAPAARYPLPGLLALKGRLVAEEVAQARERLEAARRDALAQARTLYWRLLENGGLGETTAGIGEVLARTEAAVRARYESGEGLIGDVAEVQARRERVRTELATLERERGALAAGLRALLALPQDAPIGPPEGRERTAAAAEPGALEALALERNQELRAMRAEIRAMEIMLAMGEREVLPPASLGLALSANRAARAAGTAAMEGAFATSPPAGEGAGGPARPWSGRDAAWLRDLRARLAARRQRVRGEEAAIGAQVHAAWFDLDRALREERLYAERIAGIADLAAAAADGAYRAGRVALPAALAAERERLEAQAEAVRRRAGAGVARAALERVVGAPLPDAGEGAPAAAPPGRGER